MRRARSLAIVVGAALMLASAGDAAAWCRKTTCTEKPKELCELDEHGCPTAGATLRWRKLPIVYRFSAERPGQLVREEARAAIRAAFHRWSDTLCEDNRRTSLRFVEGEDLTQDKPLSAEPGTQASEPFGIFFRDRGWPYEGEEDGTLAKTNTQFKTSSGFIVYADMEINTGLHRFSTIDAAPDGGALPDDVADLQAVVTHEVGHYIGLDHSDDPTSIMLATNCGVHEARCAKGRVAGRRLSLDDVRAVCAIYPPDGYVESEEPAPIASCAAADRGHSRSGLWVPALVGIALGIHRLRSRRRAGLHTSRSVVDCRQRSGRSSVSFHP